MSGSCVTSDIWVDWNRIWCNAPGLFVPCIDTKPRTYGTDSIQYWYFDITEENPEPPPHLQICCFPRGIVLNMSRRLNLRKKQGARCAWLWILWWSRQQLWSIPSVYIREPPWNLLPSKTCRLGVHYTGHRTLTRQNLLVVKLLQTVCAVSVPRHARLIIFCEASPA